MFNGVGTIFLSLTTVIMIIFFSEILCHTVVECRKHLEVKYLELQYVFYQTNDSEWDFDMRHANYCERCNLMPCLVEERTEDIYYIFGALRMESCSSRYECLKVYKEFSMMVYVTLRKRVCVEIHRWCVKAIRQEFPKEIDAKAKYTGFCILLETNFT